ncbi:MAG: hypothetical protein ACRD4J_01105 [Nitrososphaeraceae archaeon]
MPAATATGFSIGTTPFLILVMAVASQFDRISSIAYGIGDKEGKALVRGFRIRMNGLEIANRLIIASPAFGESTISFHIEIELAEIKGRRKRLRVFTTRSY